MPDALLSAGDTVTSQTVPSNPGAQAVSEGDGVMQQGPVPGQDWRNWGLMGSSQGKRQGGNGSPAGDADTGGGSLCW